MAPHEKARPVVSTQGSLESGCRVAASPQSSHSSRNLLAGASVTVRFHSETRAVAPVSGSQQVETRV